MVYIPPAFSGKLPVVDTSNIMGNTSDDVKQLVWSVYRYLISNSTLPVYSDSVGKRIKCVEVNVWDNQGQPLSSAIGSGSGGVSRKAAKAETVFEVKVTRDMCNLFGILHGGCAAYLMDHCSVTSVIALGCVLGYDGTGLSQSMSIVWTDAAPVGTTLRIVNSSMVVKGRIRACRSELWNGDKLCVSSVHTVIASDQIAKSLPDTASPKASHTRRGNENFNESRWNAGSLHPSKL